MFETPHKYPLGIQTFSEIREEGYLYVDKTERVYQMTHGSMKYVFLSRPRRFGKSLLVDTLRCYFEGRKELFEGLAMEKLETEWEQYPVLHFSFASAKHQTVEELKEYINYIVRSNAERLEISVESSVNNIGMMELIKGAYKKYGRKVVVLIDEYDAPLLDVVHEDTELPKLRQVMRNFYSPLLDADPMLHYCFLTGITKFSQLSIFSELNNITNISMLPRYADICGITEDELLVGMREDIDALAKQVSRYEDHDLNFEEMVDMLKKQYDGYHFSRECPDIYNPFSLLHAMALGELGSYWFGSGTPTFLINMLKKFEVLPEGIGGYWAESSDFDAPTENMTTIQPLLYQSGYVTIKDFNYRTRSYLLDIPNDEVRMGLMRSLLPSLVPPQKVIGVNQTLREMYLLIIKNKMDDALKLLKTFLSSIPRMDNASSEGHYQSLMYVILTLFGFYTDVEVRTHTGRLDMALKTTTHIYIIELKINQSAETAMQQINRKTYDDRFALSPLPVVKVGINFDTEAGTLADWKIEE